MRTPAALGALALLVLSGMACGGAPGGTSPAEGSAVVDIRGDGYPSAEHAAAAREAAGPAACTSGVLGPVIGTAIPASQYYVTGMTVGDFNGDGKPDFTVVGAMTASYLCGEYTPEVTVMAGNGDGTFTAGPLQSVPGLWPYTDVESADVDGNGTADLLYITRNSGVGVALSNAGTLTSAGQVLLAGYARTIHVADFNGDGYPDLTVELTKSGGYYCGPRGPGGVEVLLGDGAGHFTRKALLEGGMAPEGAIVGDVNGDGRADVVVKDGPKHGNLLSVFFGVGDGTFTAGPTKLTPGAPHWAADFDGDGKLDLLLRSTKALEVRFGRGDGTFRAGPMLSGLTTIDVIADLNHDGIPDLAQGASVALGNGDGTFQAVQTYGAMRSNRAADFNGDGKADLAGFGGPGIGVELGACP